MDRAQDLLHTAHLEQLEQQLQQRFRAVLFPRADGGESGHDEADDVIMTARVTAGDAEEERQEVLNRGEVVALSVKVFVAQRRVDGSHESSRCHGGLHSLRTVNVYPKYRLKSNVYWVYAFRRFLFLDWNAR